MQLQRSEVQHEVYAKMVEHLPMCVHEKLGNLAAPQTRFKRLQSLINKHTGELVVADSTRDGWRLISKDSSIARACGEQLWCFQNGESLQTQRVSQQGAELTKTQWAPHVLGQGSIIQTMDADVQRVSMQSSLNPSMLQPHWLHIKYRHTVP